MSFVAIHSGHCACCGDKFSSGEVIAYTFEGLVIAEHIKPETREPELCTKCFVTKAVNGTCNCVE